MDSFRYHSAIKIFFLFTYKTFGYRLAEIKTLKWSLIKMKPNTQQIQLLIAQISGFSESWFPFSLCWVPYKINTRGMETSFLPEKNNILIVHWLHKTYTLLYTETRETTTLFGSQMIP